MSGFKGTLSVVIGNTFRNVAYHLGLVISDRIAPYFIVAVGPET